MPKIPKFVIYMDRLNSDIDKVALLMEKFGSDMLLAGFYTPGFDFGLQAASLRSFPLLLRAMIESKIAVDGNEDVFGNVFNDFSAYDRIEVAVNSSYEFSAIRLLGDRDKSLNDRARFIILDVPNVEFTQTTVNIISDIRELSDGITEFFGVSGLSDALRCGQDSNNLENITNSVTGLVGLPPTSLAGSGVDSELTWSAFINSYVLPRVSAQPFTNQLSGEELTLVVGKYDSKPFKTLDEKLEEEAEWASAAFKGRVIATRDQAFDIVNASADILGNPEGLAAKIETLGDAYTQVLDKVSLGCLIKSAMECIIPPLSCKEILRGLRMENIEDKIALAFPNQPRLVAKVEAAIEQARSENEDEFAASDAFLDLIENFIDLEAVCDIVNFAAVGGFQIPTIELPEIDIIDLFGSVEIAIEDAILSALVTAIMQMVIGVINDLASCDNLDAFIAGALDGQIPSDSGVLGDLARLFTSPEDLFDPEKGSIASSLDARWDQFVVSAEPLLEQAVKVELEGGADILGGAIQLRADIDAAGGLEGLYEALKGNLGALAARVVFESFFQGQISLPQLLEFRGTAGAAALNSLLAEIGRFEMASDGESFTLQRVSDDQTVVIFSTLGRTSPNVAVGQNSQELANSVGPLLDDAAAILSPGDTLNLLAGTPSRRTVEVIIELIKQSHVQISFINKPDQVISLFKTLGDTTGTSNIKNAVILAANARRTRQVPRKFCPEDDEALALQEQILTVRFPPEEVRTIIDEIIEKRRLRYNELGDILVRVANDDFSPTELLEPIICGLNPDGARPEVVADALDITVNTMFESTKMTFDREIPRYSDALSSDEQITREIPRKISRSGATPTLSAGGSGGNLFGSLSGQDDEADVEELVINPEFEKLVSEGFRDPGSLEVEYVGDPVEVKDVVRRVGANFKKSFRFEQAVSIKHPSANEFEVQVKGSLPVQSPVQNYSPFPVQAPSWTLTYREQGQTLSLNLSAEGASFSQRFGRVPFSDDFFLSDNFQRVMDPDVLDRVGELNELVSGTSSKADIFTSLMKEKLQPAIEPIPAGVQQFVGQTFDAISEAYYRDRYDDFVRAFMVSAGVRVSNNRLLKKIPNRSLNHLGPGLDFNSVSKTDTLLINLINFAAAPTKEQKRCKSDPHILDLEFIKSIVKDEFDKDCENESNNDGISRSRSPINSSGYVGVVLTTIRLYAIEYVLRGLFVFDEYDYKPELIEDQMLIDYISLRIKKDIESQGELEEGVSYYSEFEKELKIVYNKLVASGQIDGELSNIISVPVINPASQNLLASLGPGANTASSLAPSDASDTPLELKAIVVNQMKSVMNKVRELVGTNPKASEGGLISGLLSVLRVLDPYSNFDGVGDQASSYTSNYKRLGFVNEHAYAIERYIRIPKTDEVDTGGLHGVVNFKNMEEFLEKNPALVEKDIDDVFPGSWQYGYRLVYITPTEGTVKILRDSTPRPPKFFFSDTFQFKLNNDMVKAEKAFHVYDKENVAQGDFKQYNVVPVVQVEIPVEFKTFKDAAGNIEAKFDAVFESRLVRKLEEEVDTRTLFDYCFFTKRLFAFLFIHSSVALSSEDMRLLFEGTKGELKTLFALLRNMGDYTSKNEDQFLDGVPGNAGAYKADFDQIGSPSGPRGPDAFYLASITPILILRGLTELIDPNINITSKIVAAGNAGYLLPKYARNPDGTIRPQYEGGPPVIQKTPVGVIGPTGFECILRESDDLPDFVSGYTEMDWDSPVVPNFSGAEIVNGRLRIPRGPDGELYGLDRSPFSENPQAVKKSVPEFPGESVNLPYGLVSLALLPLQVFWPILGPLSGPPYTPFGELFLKLEPLLYQLPNFKYAFEKTDVAEEILLSEGIDLSGAKKFNCDDGKEPDPEPETLPPASPAPDGVDSC